MLPVCFEGSTFTAEVVCRNRCAREVEKLLSGSKNVGSFYG